jgi:hypothetical protein
MGTMPGRQTHGRVSAALVVVLLVMLVFRSSVIGARNREPVLRTLRPTV